MYLSTNIIRFVTAFGLEKTLDLFADVGFRGIDFNTDLPEYYTDAHDKAFYQDIRNYAQDRGLAFSQSHAPFGSAYVDVERTKQRFAEIVCGMRHSSYLGVEMIVVHPCGHLNYREEGNREIMMDYNLDFYRRLIPYAEEYNIKIAIENINGTLTDTSDGLVELFDTLNNPVFTVCFDVGHAHIMGEDPADMIRKLGSRIGCTHIHDNNGTGDTHTLPFYGNIDWESVTKAFADIRYDGNLSYEASGFVKDLPQVMMPEGAAYMAKVGHYLIDRIASYR